MKKANPVPTALLFVGSFVVALALTYAVLYSLDSPLRIDTQEARRRLGAGEFDVVLDVRTATEREALGIYPRSLPIPASEVERELPRQVPNRASRILIYCNTGHRARLAAEKLQSLGYKNAVYYAGPYQMLI